ncbi:MAG: hypothetical protein QRY72_00650 [Candidatus Rhabdochlamydia sp.]
MSKEILSLNNRFNAPSFNEDQGKTIVYQEPTYCLNLTPLSPSTQEGDLSSHTFSNLDQAASQLAHACHQATWPLLSSSTKKRFIHHAAHNLMPRPDYETHLWIKPPLSEQQGLLAHATSRLASLTSGQIDASAFEPLATTLFSSEERDEVWKTTLNLKIHQFISLHTEGCSSQLGDDLAHLLLQMREEIKSITTGRIQYIRPASTFHALSYLNHEGTLVGMHQTHPSSQDRHHLDLQNGRMMLTHDGKVVFSTGRMETPRKAEQLLNQLVDQTLSSGQIQEEDLVLQPDGSYLYPILIENLLNTTPTSQRETNFVIHQQETLQHLTSKRYEGRLKTGKIVQLAIQPIHFSSPANVNLFLFNVNPWSMQGSDITATFREKGNQELYQLYLMKKQSLKEPLTIHLDAVFSLLLTHPHPSHQWMLHAWICELLNIPYHVHCKSSKDRTAVVAALKKGVHLFIQLEQWKNTPSLLNMNPLDLFHNPVFKEYTEAALFESLPMTDQGIGIWGDLGGHRYQANRGFDYQSSLFENPLPSLVLSDRHIQTPALLTRCLLVLTCAALSAITLIVFTALSPLIALALYLKVREKTLEVMKYLFLFIFYVPVQSALRKTWINRSSLPLKERDFFRTSHTPTPSTQMQQLTDTLNSLSSSQYAKLIAWIKQDNSQQISLNDPQWAFLPSLFKSLTHHWEVISSLKTSSSRLKTLQQAVQTSPMTLFRYLNVFCENTLFKLVSNSLIPWPTFSFISSTPLLTPVLHELEIDARRSCYVFKIHHEQGTYYHRHNNEPAQTIIDSLLKLPCFKDHSTIPHEIQIALTQASNLTPILTSLQTHLEASGLPPMNSSHRTYFIESEDASSFWIRIQENSSISDPDTASKLFTLSYSYSFKLTKQLNSSWECQFISVSPISFTLDHLSTPLLSPIYPASSLEETIHKIEAAFLKYEIKALFQNKNSFLTAELIQKKASDYMSRLTHNLPSFFLQGAMLCDWILMIAIDCQIPMRPDEIKQVYTDLITSLLQQLSTKEKEAFTTQLIAAWDQAALKRNAQMLEDLLLPLLKEALPEKLFTQIETKMMTK